MKTRKLIQIIFVLSSLSLFLVSCNSSEQEFGKKSNDTKNKLTEEEVKELNKEDIEISEEDKDNKPVTKDFLVNEGKKRGEEIKIIIEEVKEDIEDLSYRNVSEVIEKTLERIEEDEPQEETTEVVLSEKIPETVFPEVENVVTKTNPKKKKKKKKNNKKK